MSKVIIRKDSDREKMLSIIADKINALDANTDWQVVITEYKASRSGEMNRLSHHWYREMEAQGDMRAEEHKAYCKLHFGVPILRHGDEHFKSLYDSKVKNQSYDFKLMIMSEPISMPVTSLMTVKQFQQYLDEVYNDYTARGYLLTMCERE